MRFTCDCCRRCSFCRERDIAEFATQCRLPIIWDNCPACFRAPTERHRIKQLLASQEFIFPGLFPRLCTAPFPLTTQHSARSRGHFSHDCTELKRAIMPLLEVSATGVEEEMNGLHSTLSSQKKRSSDGDDDEDL